MDPGHCSRCLSLHCSCGPGEEGGREGGREVGVAIGTRSVETNNWILAIAPGVFLYIALVDLVRREGGEGGRRCRDFSRQVSVHTFGPD